MNTTTTKLKHPVKKRLQVLAPVLQKQVTGNACIANLVRAPAPEQTHSAGRRTGGTRSRAPAEERAS